MAGLKDALERWLPRARTEVERFRPEARLEQIGRIERIGDGIATVSGLPDARLDELLRFADHEGQKPAVDVGAACPGSAARHSRRRCAN